MFSRIFDFNQNVLGIDPHLPLALDGGQKQWLTQVLHEEANELGEATDLVDQVDALVDSIVFAAGGLYRLGLTVEQAQACLDAVMDANFAKRRGQKEGRKFDGVADAVKPKGWVGPEERIRAILEGQKA